MDIQELENLIAILLRENYNSTELGNNFVDFTLEREPTILKQDKPLFIEMLEEVLTTQWLNESGRGQVEEWLFDILSIKPI
tara:strand:+ start:27878 stop:28120 length:243 start_codon:yes stop_codon:yes gene_type:complete